MPLGALFGLLILARPIGQLLLLALFPVIWWKCGGFRRALLCGLVATTSCLLVLAPWMATNKRVYGFWGISHLSGVQLFHKAIDKAFMPFPPNSRHPEVDAMARAEKARQKRADIRIDWQVWGKIQKSAGFTQLKADQEMFAYAVETIRADPGYFLRDFLGDFITFFWHAKPSICVKYCDTGPYLSAPHGSRFGNSVFPSGPVKRFPWLRERLSEFFRRLGLPIKTMVVLSLVGVAGFFRTARPQRAEGLVFIIIPIYLAFFTTLFETYQDRYRLPADPFFFAFAMFSVARIAERIFGRPGCDPESRRALPSPVPTGGAPGVPDISVVILCYRAQEFAQVFVARVQEILEKNDLSYELVLVANYHIEEKAWDRTPEIVRRLASGDSRLKVIAKEKRGMMGWDMQSGLAAAEGKTIAIIDGDGQMPPEDIIRVYRKLLDDHFDMVKTYRSCRHDGWFRLLISRGYNLLLKILFPKVRVQDANSKPRILRREALQNIKLVADDWFIDAEIVIQASYLGLKIGEVPTEFRANEYRTSFVKPSAIFEFMRNLVTYRLQHWRGFRHGG
jgi:dolichol-phosphate mannosyltransferase